MIKSIYLIITYQGEHKYPYYYMGYFEKIKGVELPVTHSRVKEAKEYITRSGAKRECERINKILEATGMKYRFEIIKYEEA